MAKRIPEHVTKQSRRLRHSMTAPERLLWARLRNRRLQGLKFRRQHPIGGFVTDFYCAEAHLVVELDGESPVGRKQQDDVRTGQIESHGVQVVRVTNDDVIESLDAVCEFILREADNRI